jgi:hypothetical protein
MPLLALSFRYHSLQGPQRPVPMTSASAVAKDLSPVAWLDAIPTDLSPGVGGRLAHQQACPRGIRSPKGSRDFFGPCSSIPIPIQIPIRLNHDPYLGMNTFSTRGRRVPLRDAACDRPLGVGIGSEIGFKNPTHALPTFSTNHNPT